MLSKNPDKEFWIDPAERIEYYLNHHQTIELNIPQLYELKKQTFWTQTEVNYYSYEDFKNTFTHWYCKYLMPLPKVRDLRALPFYKRYRDLHSLIDFFLPFDSIDSNIESVKFPIFYGESGDTNTIPIIRKARKVTDKAGVLYDLRSLRYNTPCIEVERSDLEWSRKNNNVVWRGATTGPVTRESFVKKYFNKYNIGFSSVKQKPHLSEFKKNRISIADQLKSKFIVSLQGNDLASNIRWVLYSNSTLIMPKPHWTSWTMEEKLKPNVHYLELNEDLSNLDELLNWAFENDELCKEIAQNGKNYASQFLDRNYDTEVRMMLLKEYAKRLKVVE